MSTTTQAVQMSQHQGHLYWLSGTSELKTLSLHMSLPCLSLRPYFLDANNQLLPMLKTWCPQKMSAKRWQCNTSADKMATLNLQEGAHRLPWQMGVYVKGMTHESLGVTMHRVMVCSHPQRPTTRASPETCCDWKAVEGDRSSFTKTQHEKLADELKLF